MRWQKSRSLLTLSSLMFAALVWLIPVYTATAHEVSMTSITYNVGKLNGGSFEVLGKITFDAKGKAKLELDTSSEATEELKNAFAEASAKDELRLRRTERDKDADGNRVTKFVGVKIRKGTQEYPQGLIDYLSSKHGYMAQLLN